MILVGNQRGGSADLARHLLKDENDHVTVHDLRGFMADDLFGAMLESYAISKATKCHKFLFSLSLNPPEKAQVSTADFEAAIAGIEKKLGLEDQPRAIVFHEKEGRRHCHSVWSRIDCDELKARELGLYKRKLKECARDLFLVHGWEMPPGLRDPMERDPQNFTLEQWQQAKRIKKDPRQIKADFQACWQASDSRQALAAALLERGYKLARGDRRGYVAVDRHGEVYAVARWASVKTKDVRARLGHENDEENPLPSVAQCKEQFAGDISARLQELHAEEEHKRKIIEDRARAARLKLVTRQRQKRRVLRDKQQERLDREVKARQERYSKGLRGFWDRLTGRAAKIRAQNEAETAAALARDKAQRDKQVFVHVQQRRKLKALTLER